MWLYKCMAFCTFEPSKISKVKISLFQHSQNKIFCDKITISQKINPFFKIPILQRFKKIHFLWNLQESLYTQIISSKKWCFHWKIISRKILSGVNRWPSLGPWRSRPLAREVDIHFHSSYPESEDPKNKKRKNDLHIFILLAVIVLAGMIVSPFYCNFITIKVLLKYF
jgi:hypothetical protein